MKPRYRKIISAAISDGVDCGWHYAHEYTNSPSKESIKQAIIDHIMYELEDWFELDENKDGDLK